jgi:hypothetical protein
LLDRGYYAASRAFVEHGVRHNYAYATGRFQYPTVGTATYSESQSRDTTEDEVASGAGKVNHPPSAAHIPASAALAPEGNT